MCLKKVVKNALIFQWIYGIISFIFEKNCPTFNITVGDHEVSPLYR